MSYDRDWDEDDGSDREREMSSKDDWHEWLDALERDGVNLSSWETDFVESIRLQLRSGRTLSEKQADTLERIYSARTP